MSAIVPAVIGMVPFLSAISFYSKFIAEKIYRLDPNFETPAHTLQDDVDFIPTNRVVLWGHHFTAVAGAAPIIGPAIAVIWGWLPAFIWVIGGTMFFAGVHDFGAIWASVRNQGRSVGSLTRGCGKPARTHPLHDRDLLSANDGHAVFAVAISNAFVATPSSVIPAWSAIAVAVVIGVLIYRVGVPILWPTVVGYNHPLRSDLCWRPRSVELPEVFLGLGSGLHSGSSFCSSTRRSRRSSRLAPASAKRLHQRDSTLHRVGTLVRCCLRSESDGRRAGV